MKNNLSRLFNQTATWKKTVPSTTSLTEETTESHALGCIRISVETVGTGSDTTGVRSNSGSVLYWLIGKSTCDGDACSPSFGFGDRIVTDTRSWTVVSVYEYASLLGGVHHLEVSLE